MAHYFYEFLPSRGYGTAVYLKNFIDDPDIKDEGLLNATPVREKPLDKTFDQILGEIDANIVGQILARLHVEKRMGVD